MLYYIWKTTLTWLLTLLEVLQSAEIRARTENRMVHAFGVFEIGGILEVTGYSVGGEAAWTVAGLLGGGVPVAIGRRHLFFAFFRRERDILRPQGWIYAVFEHQVRTDICKNERFP